MRLLWRMDGEIQFRCADGEVLRPKFGWLEVRLPMEHEFGRPKRGRNTWGVREKMKTGQCQGFRFWAFE
jgi:hypothetical protein